MEPAETARLREGVIPEPRRVLLIANTDWYLYNFRLSLARSLREAGWETTLISPPGPYTARIQESGFRWLPLPIERAGMSPLMEWATLLRVWRLYRKERPLLVHHFTVKPVLYGSLVARCLGVPAIVNSITGLGHLFLTHTWSVNLLRRVVLLLYRLLFRSSKVRVIFENTSDLQFFLQHGVIRSRQASIIQGVGVDLDRFRPTSEPDGVPVVIQVSRLLWEKGIAVFVEAARKLHEKGVRARFVLVGNPDPGNPSSITQDVLMRWAEEGFVEWWGHRDDMPEVFAGCHIVALPSYGEGVPTVLLEAAACARPVVATDIPGCREVVRHGETGILVAVGDSDALAEALEALIRAPDVRARMGALGRKRAENDFSQKMIASQTIAVYEKLLAGTGQGAA